MAEKINITSRAGLENWLKDNPRAWAVAIAARAALRSLPAIAPWVNLQNSTSTEVRLILAVFRATLISSAAATGPADHMKAAARAATGDVRAAVRAAAYAAYAAATDNAADAAADATSAAAAAADAAAAAAAAYGTDAQAAEHACWLEIFSDAKALIHGGSEDAIALLLQAPLWRQGDVPSWTLKGWSALRDSNVLSFIGFAPWFEWYESLLPLSGASPTDRFGPGLTRRIAFQSKTWWDRGAKAVNADIATWLSERDLTAAKDIPRQVPAAYRFSGEEGRIGLAPQGIAATDLATAQMFLDDLRERATQAAERLESAGNAVPFLAGEVSRLRDFLPSTATDLNPFLLRSRLLTIEAAVATLQTAGPSRELGDDPTMQVTALALSGQELMLCFPDLRTREREEIARAIPGQEGQIAEALAEVSEAAANAPEVVTEDAAAALKTMSTMVSEAAGGPMKAQQERIVEQVIVNRNFRSEVVRFGWLLWDGVLNGTEAAANLSKHAVIFSFAGLVSRLANPDLGRAAVFVSYGKTERALKLLDEQFTKRAKELKKSAKHPKADK